MADPLSISASVAGLVTLADAVFRATFRYVKAVKNAKEEISSNMSEIQELTAPRSQWLSNVIGSVPLHTKSLDLAQPHHADQTNQSHPPKHGPERSPIASHESLRGMLVNMSRPSRDRRCHNLCDAQPYSGTELGAGVEDGAAQGLHVLGVDVRDDQQPDGEEHVAGDGRQDLAPEGVLPVRLVDADERH